MAVNVVPLGTKLVLKEIENGVAVGGAPGVTVTFKTCGAVGEVEVSGLYKIYTMLLFVGSTAALPETKLGVRLLVLVLIVAGRLYYG